MTRCKELRQYGLQNSSKHPEPTRASSVPYIQWSTVASLCTSTSHVPHCHVVEWFSSFPWQQCVFVCRSSCSTCSRAV